MYSAILTIHSWLRWVNLILAIFATINAMHRPGAGSASRSRWWDMMFMVAIDVQVLVGLLLYFGLSPFTTQAMNDMGAAMRNPGLRFWLVEHAAGMFAVMVLVRVGRILASTAASPDIARSRRAICFTLATIVMILSIPWPGMPNGRPLFRF